MTTTATEPSSADPAGQPAQTDPAAPAAEETPGAGETASGTETNAPTATSTPAPSMPAPSASAAKKSTGTKSSGTQARKKQKKKTTTPVKIRTIVSVPEVGGITVRADRTPVLPATVTVRMSNGVDEQRAVTWPVIDPGKMVAGTSFPLDGTITLAKTQENPRGLRVTTTVTVIPAPTLVSLAPWQATTGVGTEPWLPPAVWGAFSDGSHDPAAVAWDTTNPAFFTEPGTVTVTGHAVSDTTKKVTALITVTGTFAAANMSASGVRPGDPVTGQVSGFAAAEVVNAVLVDPGTSLRRAEVPSGTPDPGVALGSCTTDSSGACTAILTVPTTTAHGSYAVEFRGTTATPVTLWFLTVSSDAPNNARLGPKLADPALAIASLDTLEPVTVLDGEPSVTLPGTVMALMSDGTSQRRVVTWPALTDKQRSTPGEYTLNGTLNLRSADDNPTALTPTVTVRIIGPVTVTRVNPQDIYTTTGARPQLPEHLVAVFEDKDGNHYERPIAVTWPQTPESQLSQVGVVDLRGTLPAYPGFDGPVVVHLHVQSPYLAAAISQTTTAPGTQNRATAQGFQEGEALEVCLNAWDGSHSLCQRAGAAGAQGWTRVLWTTPDAAPGRYQVQIRGEISGTAQARDALTITKAAPPNPDVTGGVAMPSTDAGEVLRAGLAASADRSTVQGTASGFTAGEHVQVTLGSTTIVWSGDATADGTVAVDLSTSALPQGVHQVAFRGAESGTVTLTLTVDAASGASTGGATSTSTGTTANTASQRPGASPARPGASAQPNASAQPKASGSSSAPARSPSVAGSGVSGASGGAAPEEAAPVSRLVDAASPHAVALADSDLAHTGTEVVPMLLLAAALFLTGILGLLVRRRLGVN